MPKKILIVEDEFFLGETIKDRLGYLGYDCHWVEDGSQALTYLKSQSADVVIMDAMMPVMDGWEATKKIKSQPAFKKLPVIFLSARAQPADKEKAFEVGADDYIIKPFEMDELVDCIKKWS